MICNDNSGQSEWYFFGKLSLGKGAQEVIVKRSRFSVEQIVALLKHPEFGKPVADVIRKIGISEPSFYFGKKQYASLEPD